MNTRLSRPLTAWIAVTAAMIAASMVIAVWPRTSRAAGSSVDTSATSGSTYGVTNCVQGSATLMGGLANRITMLLQNRGPNSIYVGTDSSVTSTNGIEVQSGTALALDVKNTIPVYCIAVTADQTSPSNTRYLELR